MRAPGLHNTSRTPCASPGRGMGETSGPLPSSGVGRWPHWSETGGGIIGSPSGGPPGSTPAHSTPGTPRWPRRAYDESRRDLCDSRGAAPAYWPAATLARSSPRAVPSPPGRPTSHSSIRPLTLGQRFDRYLADNPQGHKESTLGPEETHMKHLRRFLGKRTVDSISLAEVQGYDNMRNRSA